MTRPVLLVIWLAAALACSPSPTAPSPAAAAATPVPPPEAPAPTPLAGPPMWDIEASGVPRFIGHDYLDLSRIVQISRFRSAEGHDYSDELESCRSMKHYFRPDLRPGMDASTIPVFSPVTGEVVRTIQEWAGVQIWIQPADQPAFVVKLFHVNANVAVTDGTRFVAGQRLGTHIGNETASDVAIEVSTPQGRRLVSWFDAITDALFDTYRVRGVTGREQFVITRLARDADALTCSQGAFLTRGAIPGWVALR